MFFYKVIFSEFMLYYMDNTLYVVYFDSTLTIRIITVYLFYFFELIRGENW